MLYSGAELADDRQLNPDGTADHLDFEPREYAMVVIDEAHNLRNPATLRADALRKLLAGIPPKDLVMLTATPVNNSLWDLHTLLYYFIKNDAAFADSGIRSLRDRASCVVQPRAAREEATSDRGPTCSDLRCVRKPAMRVDRSTARPSRTPP